MKALFPRTTFALATFALVLPTTSIATPRVPVIDSTPRTYDGSQNNLAHPEWGAVAPYDRLTPAAYADGISTPARSGNLSARAISNILHTQTTSRPNRKNLNDLWQAFATVVTTDFAFGASNPTEAFPISVPAGDPVFGAVPALPFFRGLAVSTPTREQLNVVSPWLDLGIIYGGNEPDARLLRTLDFDGQSPGALISLPLPTGEHVLPTIGLIKAIKGIPASSNPASIVLNLPAPSLLAAQDYVFTSGFGFSGPNISPNSSMILTLAVREHNRLAQAIDALSTGVKSEIGLPARAASPAAYDEAVFQLARKILIAEFQAIFYDEFLPAIGVQVGKYKGYDPTLRPKVYTEFTASLAVGHSAVRHEVTALNESRQVLFNAPLKSTVFNSVPFLTLGADAFLRGALVNWMEEIDAGVVDDLRNVAAGATNDIIAETIQRGRDRGVADFNSVRVALGERAYGSFYELTGDTELSSRLAQAYPGGIGTLDPAVGFMVEEHWSRDGVGPTSVKLWEEQFALWRDADRKWYQNALEVDPTFSTALDHLGFDLKPGKFQTLEITIAQLILNNSSIGNGGFPLNRRSEGFVFDERRISLPRPPLQDK